MQTDQEQTKPPEQKAKPEKPKESRKEILLRKKAKNHDRLPPALQEELDEILAAEKAAHDHAALVHTLSANADKWGRKEIGVIKREVTDRVRVFGGKENTETTGVQKIYAKGKADMEREMKATMQQVQETHNKGLKALKEQLEKDLASVRERYSGQYKEAEFEIRDRTDQTLNLVGDFTAALPDLTLEQLKELSDKGVLQVTDTECLVVPGETQKA
jgi:hypothetical protein